MQRSSEAGNSGRNHIGLRNERSLHAALKQHYELPGDRTEVHLEGYIVDILRDDLLIEIQTRNFSSIRKKLERLCSRYRVKLVFPIPTRTWIVTLDATRKRQVRRRRSPKRGSLKDLYDELVHIPQLIRLENFSLEAVLIREEQIRCLDGKGSWRRGGISIIDRRLLEIEQIVTFNQGEDFLGILPPNLEKAFTNKILARSLGCPVSQARKITYCLRKAGLLDQQRKEGRELLFQRLL